MQPTKSDYVTGGIMANMLLLAMVMYFLAAMVGGMSDLWFKIPLFLAVAALLCGIGVGIINGVRNEIQSRAPVISGKNKRGGSRSRVGARKQTARKVSSKTPLEVVEDGPREVVEQQSTDGAVK